MEKKNGKEMKEKENLDLPIITKSQNIIRKRQTALAMKIREGIDEICIREKYKVTYAEINSALVEVLRTNLNYEIRDLLKKVKKKDLKDNK